MANDTSGNLDEFFDFARLEADMNNGLHSDCQKGELIAQSFSDNGMHSAMEWEPSAPDSPTQFDASYRPLPYSSECTVSNPEWSQSHPTPSSYRWPANHAEGSLQLPLETILSTTMMPGVVSTWPSSPGLSAAKEVTLTLLESGLQSTPVEAVPQPPRRSTSTNRRPAPAKVKGTSRRIPLKVKQVLEDEFSTNPYPCSWEIDIIAHQVNLDTKQVRTWFNNARARKVPRGNDGSAPEETCSVRSLASKLSAESLETLSKQADDGPHAPQPPLAVYLASSYVDEGVELSDIQAAIETTSSSAFMDSSSGSRMGKSGSVITSLTSSEASAPTSYTMSSAGSNTSSFGRDRRRGRRRMTWKHSPYSRSKIDGLNDAGLPSRNLPYFCTFCPRAFKTKYEWRRHEDSVHALSTTWICCSTRQQELAQCPFCGETSPDEVHLAGHKYQQCRNKPETHRTFYRRDHFIQHLHHVHFANVKHPSLRSGCGTRTTAEKSKNYGCNKLAMAWRRFGAPMRPNDPMLHCGFCGKTLKDWNTRCDHIAEHLVAGGWDKSSWWPERKENHLENLCSPRAVGPFRCRYCQKVFANVGAMNNHRHCRVWSCRFLKTFDDVTAENTGPPLCPQFPSPKAHHCHLCGAGYRSGHSEHAQQYHNYRLCEQELYTDKEDFLQHLHEFHAASNPLLLMNNAVLEQNFCIKKGACFEPVDFDEILQGCRVATPTASFVDPFSFQGSVTATSMTEEAVDCAQGTISPPRKQSDGIRHEKTTSSTRDQPRHETVSKLEPSGPRLFRLDPLVPFLSSRIYYLRNAKMSDLFSDGNMLLREVKHGHIASLVMTSGLVGMAGVRLPTLMKRDDARGVVEFAMDD